MAQIICLWLIVRLYMIRRLVQNTSPKCEIGSMSRRIKRKKLLNSAENQ